jgi:hypothetical protein
MPPVQSAWQPSPEELLLVKQWVGDGARDEYGTNTISSKLAAELISPDRPEAPGGATSPQVTFKDTYRRYLAGHDFFRLMEQKFPKAGRSPKCNEFTDLNRALLGETNPATGDPTYRTPSAAFVRWYGRCLLGWIEGDVGNSYPKEMDRFFGKTAIERIRKEPYAAVLTDAKSVTWGTLSDEIRVEVIGHLVGEYIGPEVMTGQAEFVNHLNDATKAEYAKLTTLDGLKRILFLIGTQEEFLSY